MNLLRLLLEVFNRCLKMEEKKEFTVELFRQALKEYYDDTIKYRTLKMSDEELLESKMKEDFGMDSLSLIEIIMQFEKITGRKFDDEMFNSQNFKSDGTVRGFLELCSHVAR